MFSNIVRTSIFVSLLCAFAGCATIVSKSRYAFSIKANEPETTVTVYDKKNNPIKFLTAPATIELDADFGMFSSASYRFVFEKAGFDKDESEVKAGIDPCYWINLICIYSAPLGMLFVDPFSGAMWAFDENATVTGYLRPKAGVRIPQVAQTYRLVSCERESGHDFAYRFVLELTDTIGQSIQTLQNVQSEFSSMVKNRYVESHTQADKESIGVEFSEFELKNGRISGRVVVLSFCVASLFYDPNTRTGKLAVKVNANQYEEARKWIRKNIETLARDKNIALTTGEIPPAAKFYLGREELKEGNVLEIEFRTE